MEDSFNRSGQFVRKAFGEQVFLTTLVPSFFVDYSRLF